MTPTNLSRRAFALEYFTIAWMVIETAVAIGSGVVGHSVTLVAFGGDSVIELLSALVLVWRLAVEQAMAKKSLSRLKRARAKLEPFCFWCCASMSF